MKPTSMASSAPAMLVIAYGMKKGVIFLWPWGDAFSEEAAPATRSSEQAAARRIRLRVRAPWSAAAARTAGRR